MVRCPVVIVLCSMLGSALSLSTSGCGSSHSNDDPDGGTLDPDRGRPDSPIVDFDIGTWTACSAHADGSVRCWGGKITDFSTPRTLRWNAVPTRVEGIEGAVDVTVGGGFACALDGASKVHCWGYASDGGPIYEHGSPHEITELAGVAEIDADTSMLCGRFVDGRVRCRGSYWDSGVWYDIRDLEDAVSLSVGGDYGCALRKDTTAVCWGRFLQETGLPRVHDLPNPIVNEKGVPLTGVATVEASSGLGGLPPSTYLVMDDGRLLGMGANEAWQLAATTPVIASAPLAIPVNGVQSVAAGQGYACALTGAGALSCWGRNDHGTLGNGTIGASNATPLSVAIAGATRIEAGETVACALTDGRLWCWGSNADFLLGTRAPGPAAIRPALIADTEGVKGAALNVPWQSVDPKGCLLTREGDAMCAGQDEVSQFFSGPLNRALTETSQIAVGPWHTCAVRSDTSVWCWGFNYAHQLGVSSPEGQVGEPVQAVGVSKARTVGVSELGTCALLEDGAVSCWGTGGVVSAPFDPPTRRSDVTDAVDLSVANASACAALRDGSAVCWGGAIQHPSGAAAAFGTAVKLPTPESIVSVAADDTLGCALGTSGALYCWRGMGSFPYEAYPGPPPFPAVVVADQMPPLVDVGAADGRVCGVTADGEVWCMEEFPDNEVPTGPLPQPTQVEGIDDAQSIVVTFGATCATTPRGLACWGEVPFHQGRMYSARPIPLDY